MHIAGRRTRGVNVARAVSTITPRRVATLSVHTSPLDQPGTGDAGGMNVYIVEVAPGVTVRHVSAGPFEGLAKEELPAQMCAFTNGVLRAEAARAPGHYDL